MARFADKAAAIVTGASSGSVFDASRAQTVVPSRLTREGAKRGS